MIKKFISIQNVGRFLNYTLKGDVELKKYSIFFAENGRGKSTLCALLRSLQTNDASLLIGRTTLGEGGVPFAKVLLDIGTSEFTGESWTIVFPELEIFDSTFISENIYSGDIVNLDHRRNLYSIIIGSEGVGLANQIDDLDELNRSKSLEIREKRTELTAYVPQGITFELFMDLEKDEDIDSKIELAQVEIQRKNEAERIIKRETLSSLVLLPFPSGMFDLLVRNLEGLSTEAQKIVTDQIEKHKMHTDGEVWLSLGLDYVIDNECPFCGRNLDAVQDLIEAYKAYFVEAYKDLTREIEEKHQEILRDLSDLVIAGYERILDKNIAGLEYWTRYCEVSLPDLSIDGIGVSEILLNLRQTSINLLDKKNNTPLVSIVADDKYKVAESRFKKLLERIEIYNKAIKNVNETIEKVKADIESTDLEEIEKKILILQATKNRHDKMTEDGFSAYKIANEEKSNLEKQKAEAKKNLDAYSTDVLQRYEETINNLLDEINAGFRISNASHGYPGGIAATSYKILINNTPVELGDGTTNIDLPSFRNTLSSGDKNTLALVFFLARLMHNDDLENKVVIFDDPFNSQDRFRKEWTVRKIINIGERSKQVIVLSHDDNFLSRVWKQLVIYSDSRKALKLARVGECNTQIVDWDIDEASESQDTSDRNDLTDYYHNGSDNLGEIIKKIRPVLETHLRLINPSEFGDDNLGPIIGKIRETGTTHVLFDILWELDLINEYTSKYHHGDTPNEIREIIDDNELHRFVKTTLAIVGC